MAIRQGGRLWIARAAIAAGGAAGVLFLFLSGGVDPASVCAGTLTTISGQPVTFTRASTKYCTAADGGMTLLSNNIPAVEAPGLFMEASAVNLALQSQTLDNASWVKTGVTATAPVVTANQDTAPDQTVTADQIAYPAVPSGASYLGVQFTGTTGKFTSSVYLRSATATTVYLTMCRSTASVCNGVNYFGTTTCSVTSTWSRCKTASTALTATTYILQVGVDLRDGGQAAKGAQTVFAWGAQAELQPGVTSYIPTTTASVTRSADTASVALAQSSPSVGSIGVTMTPQFAWGSTNSNIFSRGTCSSSNSLCIQTATTAKPNGLVTDGSGSFFRSATVTNAITADLTKHRFATGFNQSLFNYFNIDGAGVAFTNSGSGTDVTFGATLSVNSASGWLTDFCFDTNPYKCQ